MRFHRARFSRGPPGELAGAIENAELPLRRGTRHRQPGKGRRGSDARWSFEAFSGYLPSGWILLLQYLLDLLLPLRDSAIF